MLAGLGHRLGLLVTLETGVVTYPSRLRRSVIRSALRRWADIARLSGTTRWGAREFHYETRFEPVLMHVHQRLAVSVSSAIAQRSRGPIHSVLDIGANVGQFAFSMLAIEPGLRVLSLEPNPEVFEILLDNAAQIPTWEVAAKGVSDTSGVSHLHFVPGRSGQGSLEMANASRSMWQADESLVMTTQVELVTGTWIAENYSADWDLVKIDVEGHERAVLAGISDLRWRFLLIEIAPARGGIEDERELQFLLADQGVQIDEMLVIEASAQGKDVLVCRKA